MCKPPIWTPVRTELTRRSGIDTLWSYVAIGTGQRTYEYPTSIGESAVKEDVMKLAIVQLGRVSKVTRDYSGDFLWDAFVYDYRKHRPFG